MANTKISAMFGYRNILKRRLHFLKKIFFNTESQFYLKCLQLVETSSHIKSDGQEISTKILISWQELKNRFLSFFVHK